MNLKWLPQIARLQAIIFLCNACHRNTSRPLGHSHPSGAPSTALSDTSHLLKHSTPSGAPSTALSDQEIMDYFRWAYHFDPDCLDSMSCKTLIKRQEGEVLFLSMSANSGVPACEFVLYFRSAGTDWTLVEQGGVKGTFRAQAQWSLDNPQAVTVIGMDDEHLGTLLLPTKSDE